MEAEPDEVQAPQEVGEASQEKDPENEGDKEPQSTDEQVDPPPPPAEPTPEEETSETPASAANSKEDGEQDVEEAPKPEEPNGKAHTNGDTHAAATNGVTNGATSGTTTNGATNGKEEPAAKQQPSVTVGGANLRQLLVGTDMIKVKGKKYLPRIFRITEDLLRVIWISRRKAPVKAQIYLGQIQSVSAGRDTPTFRRHPHPQHSEDVCLSIVYRPNGKDQYIDLIAPTQKVRDLWVCGLQALIKNSVSNVTSDVRRRWLQKLFREADKNGDGTLDLKEIKLMMKKLNVGVSEKLLKSKFKAVDDGDNSLQFSEFCSLFQDFSDRPEVRRLFNLYASENGFMTCDDLKSFLESEQGEEEVTSGYCQSIVERFEPSSEGIDRGLLSVDGFVQFLISQDCDIFRREHSEVYQDMNQPLSHYYIASSHNTYLMKDQLQGPSSIQAYINALRRGCRCVELDCWNGSNNEPVVYHGHTLTSKILFKDVIAAIKEHAFATSPYPVILSIENHCSVEQQHVMAQYMIDIFGDMLHSERRDETRPSLPSPEELKYKILIKAKKLSKDLEDQEEDDGGDVSDEDEAAEIDPEEIKQVKKSSAKEGGESEGAKGDATERSRTPSPTPKSGKKLKLSAKLSRLVNYIQSVSFKNLEHNTTIPCYHMSSFGESKAFGLSDSAAHHFMEYNKRHISRIYPAGTRVNSSNYEPVDMWNCGCQIVALNYQTPGKPMDWNMGKFQQNGNCGYILKPEIMRQDFAVFNHKLNDIVPGVPQKVLTMRIISGQQLPKPEGGSATGEIVDPYVMIQVAGVPIDRAEFKTKVVDDNGFNPVWNECLRHVLYFPELALVHFCVMDHDIGSQDDFIGQFTLPFASMTTGYRHVCLHNSKWEKIPGATLFLHINIGDWIAPPQHLRQRAKELTVHVGSVKSNRQYCGLKYIIPDVNHHYTVNLTASTLQTATDLRENYHFSLLMFKESCGKPMYTPLAECVSMMSATAKTQGVSLRLISHKSTAGKEVFEVEGKRESGEIVESGTIHRVLVSFNQLNHHLMILLNIGENAANELDKAAAFTTGMKDKMEAALTSSAYPQKKVPEVRANYSWNVRVLQSEASQLRETFNSAATTLQKIRTAAEQCGIPISSSQ